MSSDKDIGFEDIPKKEVPPLINTETKALRDSAIKKLEKEQVNQQVRAEAGITPIPKAEESIPKELPKLVFKLVAKVISCDRFNLDDEEARVMAKHFSNIVGALNSKWYSAIIIVIVVISKISDCFGAVSNLMKHGKKDKEELKAQGRPEPIIYGDGTV